MEPPETRREIVADKLHGVTIEDPYRWLEDQESPETRAWIDRQMSHTRSVLDTIPGRDELTTKLALTRKIASWSSPIERAGRYFYTYKAPDAQLAVIAMWEGLDGGEEILLDPHGMSPDQTTSVGIHDVSADGKRLIYNVRQGGEDEVVLRLYDVDRRTTTEEFPKGRYAGTHLETDGSGLRYVRWAEEGPRVFLHRFGDDVAKDTIVFGQQLGMDNWISIYGSSDGRYVAYNVSFGWERNEVYLQDLQKTGPPVLLTAGTKARFEPRFAGSQLFIATDWEAPNRRVMTADPARPGIANWTETVAETGQPLEIEDFEIAGDGFVIHRLNRAVSRLELYSSAGELRRSIEPRGASSVSQIAGWWGEPNLFYGTQSFVSPKQVNRLELSTLEESVWAGSESSPLDSAEVEIQQVSYRSKDETEVPMFLVHRKGMTPNGDTPALLNGYGGFNLSMQPSFSPLASVFVENGGLYAVANLRGGGELGEDWHKAGMLANKQNVFDDFIAAAEWLFEKQYTKPERLAIIGGSNGGLLVGAVMTQRPDLFQAVVCTYPLLDMLRYHRFMLGKLWTPEYGSAEDPEQFEYLHAYSPYHRVVQGADYPAVLFKTGDGDTRVAPLHARKMAALMQWATAGSENPVLLRYDTKFGHSAGMPVAQLIESDADVLQFLRWRLGM